MAKAKDLHKKNNFTPDFASSIYSTPTIKKRIKETIQTFEGTSQFQLPWKAQHAQNTLTLNSQPFI